MCRITSSALSEVCGWGYMQTPQKYTYPLKAYTQILIHVLPQKSALRGTFDFTCAASAPRPTQLCRSWLLLLTFHFHFVRKPLCNQKMALRGPFAFYFRRCGAPYVWQGEASVFIRFGFGLWALAFDVNQFVRTDIWNLPLRCVQITPLVFYQIFWYNTKGGWYIPKVFGFLGFVISANLKNANPKISSFTFRLFPRCHGQWLNSNLELRDELTLGTETMVLVRRPLVRHNIQVFDQAHARAALSAITSRASAPLHVFSKRHVAFSLCPHGHRHVADLRAGCLFCFL